MALEEQDSRGLKEMMDIAFNFLKIVVDRKARTWKRVPLVRSVVEETLRIYGYIKLWFQL